MLTKSRLIALPLLTMLAGTAAHAAPDGYYNVVMNSSSGGLGIELVQLGEHGELTLDIAGFSKMGYGKCIVNFTRDEAGQPKDYAPVIQQNAATCPETITFTLEDGTDGMPVIKFTEGGSLKGESSNIFPVLLPYKPEFAPKHPQNFNILGMTNGQTRAEVEKTLEAEGYKLNESWSGDLSYEGFTRALAVYSKYDAQNDPKDSIGITYTAKYDGGPEERAITIQRKWILTAEDNISVNTLRKSLGEKHGIGNADSPFNAYHFDREGNWKEGASRPICDDKIHLQPVSVPTQIVGSSSDGEAMPIACGVELGVSIFEDYSSPGRAEMLTMTLKSPEVAYEDFWLTWSRGEATALKARYDSQMGMAGNAPKL